MLRVEDTNKVTSEEVEEYFNKGYIVAGLFDNKEIYRLMRVCSKGEDGFDNRYAFNSLQGYCWANGSTTIMEQLIRKSVKDGMEVYLFETPEEYAEWLNDILGG